MILISLVFLVVFYKRLGIEKKELGKEIVIRMYNDSRKN